MGTERSSKAQRRCNDRRARTGLTAAIRDNFSPTDYAVTLTYDPFRVPQSRAEGNQSIQTYLRRLRTSRAKRGEELRYVYVTEEGHPIRTPDPQFGPDRPETERLHHHAVISGGDRYAGEELAALWHGGGYVRAVPLDPGHAARLARYLSRETGKRDCGRRRWNGSRNLMLHNPTDLEKRGK